MFRATSVLTDACYRLVETGLLIFSNIIIYILSSRGFTRISICSLAHDISTINHAVVIKVVPARIYN